MGGAQRGPRRPPAGAAGGGRILDAAPLRRPSLPPWTATKLGPVVEQDEAQAGVQARDGLAAGQGRGRGVPRRVEAKAGAGAAPLLLSGEAPRAPARVFGTAPAAKRSAPPARGALSASVVPLSGRGAWRLGGCTGAKRAARWRLKGVRRRSRARGARRAAGETEAWGSLPPRRRAAIGGASLVAFLPVPPGRACMERAGPSTQGRRSAAPQSARQSQGKRQATAPPKPSGSGATAWRNGAGAAGLWRWSSRAPSWRTMQTYRRRASPALPQEKGGGWV